MKSSKLRAAAPAVLFRRGFESHGGGGKLRAPYAQALPRVAVGAVVDVAHRRHQEVAPRRLRGALQRLVLAESRRYE